MILLYAEVQECLAGYDMQFDIKYAYFNFLQSIHHPEIKNMTLPKSECNDKGSDAENSSRDEAVC